MKLDWDHYSDQPAVIRNKAFKKEIYKKTRWHSMKLLVTNIFMYPICLLNYFVSPIQKVDIDTSTFFGISINLDKNPEETIKLIEDLGAKNILIRMPLSDIDNIQRYVDFASQFKDKNLLINILQDRDHVEDHQRLETALDRVFTLFSPLTNHFQLGNTINRKKWAFFSMDEFLNFYKVGFDLRNAKFPNIKLLGSSVIDFEYYFSIRTLFNLYTIRFDQFTSLLYVDRRGAPENTQMGLDLRKKLHLMQAMLRLSPKSSNEIVITETNWPINDTFPYAPTTDVECAVDLETHADFLVRYYLLALSSHVVKSVYWHQLIAPGYGLIDNRKTNLIKYPAYTALKVMLSYLQESNYISFKIKDDQYTMSFIDKKNTKIDVIWTTSDRSEQLHIDQKTQTLISREGEELLVDHIKLTGSPVYLLTPEIPQPVS